MYEEKIDCYNLSIDELHLLLKEAICIIDSVAREIGATYYLHAGTALGAIRHKGFIPWDEDADVIIPINNYEKLINALKARDLGKFEILYYDKKATRMQAKIVLKGQDEDLMCVDLFPLIGTASSMEEQKLHDKQIARIRKIYKFKRLKYSESTVWYKYIVKYMISEALSVFPDSYLYRKYNDLITKYPFESAEFVTNPCGKYSTKNVLRKEIYGTPVFVEFEGKLFPIPAMIDPYLSHYYGDYMKCPSEDIINEMINSPHIFKGTLKQYQECIHQ